MKQHRNAILILLVSNFLGAFLIFSYFAYIDLETYRANKAFWRGTQADWTAFTVAMVLLSVLGALVAWRYGRSLARWETKLRQSETTLSIPRRIRRWAAAYPLTLALISLLTWIAAGLFFGQGGLMFGSTNAATFTRTFLGVGVVGGITASMLVFLGVDAIWGDHLPQFFPDWDFDELKVRRFSVGQRLVATFLLTGLVPLFIMGVTTRNGALSVMDSNLDPYEILDRIELTAMFIVGVGLVSNVLLSALMTRSLARPLKDLTKAMNQVAQGDLSPRVPVTSNDELGDLSHHFNDMLAKLEQSQRMRDLFGRYVSKEVAEQVLRQGANLGGENVAATALFADIRDFTGLAERMPPQQVVGVLNRYYTRMVDVIIGEGGLVNKFGGDSMLAIFGAPIRQPDHALRAVQAAGQMMRVLGEFNAEQSALGLPPLTIGIGISSGDMVAGNIGGQARMEYTVIGDPVNVASRLQTLTKEWGAPVLLSEDTCQRLNSETAAVQPRERIIIRGRQEPTLIYELRPTS